MALLAAYLAEKRQGQTLESWLDGVFAAGSRQHPAARPLPMPPGLKPF